VVYADWLRGQGLLLIIDHGEGYLSLYGHNRSLLRSVGDQVNPGDVIARIGNTGGLDKPALYFEIREAGSPVDPGLWLSR
jgi:septal ring factor EnvC (AmiA/AmiB activator)